MSFTAAMDSYEANKFLRTKSCSVAVLRGGGGAEGAYAHPNRPAGAMLCSRNLHYTDSKPYVDQGMDIRTFYVTQDRENPTDSA